MDCPRPPFLSVAHCISARLHARPDADAIRFRGTAIGNGALLHKVLTLADGMRASGIGPGTRAGVCLEREPVAIALLLALWWRAAVYVPLDPTLPRERLFAMCEVAELDLVITQAELRHVAEVLPCPVLRVDADFPGDARLPAALPAPDAPCETGTLAYILFTSGSSGVPKGVKIVHGNLAAFFTAALPLLGLTDACRVLGCANFCFDIAFFELLAPLLCGGTLVLADRAACSSPLGLVQLIERERVTLVQATPSHWQLLAAPEWPAPLGTAIAIGEPLLRDTAAAILQRAHTLWNTYGPTECTVWASAHRVTQDDLCESSPAVISIGRALPGYTLHLEPVATDAGTHAEELVIGGAAVGLGYCASPDDGAFRLTSTGRGYRSGDLCRRDAEGRFHYCGRRDNQAKHNGHRIEPDEIALLLRQNMSIAHAVCLVRPAEGAMPSLLFACVVFRSGMPNRTKAALNDYLSSYLPEWMLPQRYFFLDELPLNANGKLDRAALFALTAAQGAPGPPGTLATRVAAIFCEVLDIASIGPCDSFFDAGGSSMLTATLVMTLNERLGGNITLRDALARPPTVSGIVQLLRASPPSQAS